MKKTIQNMQVCRNTKLNENYFVLELLAPEKIDSIKPGQFVEVLVEGSPETFLRRPISINDVDIVKNTITLLIKIVGSGTKQLSKVEKGSQLNVVYPLGNGFTIKKQSKALLVGGGCGVAPLLYLARFLKENNEQPVMLLGGKCSDDVLLLDKFMKYGEVHVTTEDCSLGEKGFVTQHSIFENPDFDIIYTCGPEPMMKAVAKYAASKIIDCEVSLENTMACGVGACLCCVTDTIKGNVCVCTEGPVFNINELKWQI
jgi:dihydroorotate dehydrogenase electron transfer subunit